MARRVRDFHAWETLRAAGLVLATALAATPSAAEELLAGAAVSLRDPLTAIAREYEARHPGERVTLSFGASSTLAAQARAGAPLDVFVSADPGLVDGLERAELLAPGARKNIARNTLVVVAGSDAAARLASAEDLVDADVRRVALPAPGVPMGRYARTWLAGRGLLEPLAGRTVQTEHARATLAAVDAGHADAAVVYATDARFLRNGRVAYVVPESEHPVIFYTAACLRRARPGACGFYEFLSDAVAVTILVEAGFGKP